MNLVESAVTPAAVVPGIGKPAFPIGFEKILLGDCAISRKHGRREAQANSQSERKAGNARFSSEVPRFFIH